MMFISKMGWLVMLMMVPLLCSTASAVEYQIVVKKGERKLELLCDGQSVKTYRIALDENDPIGAKQQQSDHKTPEGVYFICEKRPQTQSEPYKSLGPRLRLNYPNSQDAKRGLEQKWINQNQYERIVSAERTKTAPPGDTRLGEEMFIQGGGAASDWKTFGDIALNDADIKELYDTVSVGTVVTILP